MQHPSKHLKPEWIKTIRENASAAEQMGMLHPDQLALVHQQKWFKFLVPEAYSGLQLDLPKQVRLEESLAWANGSLGWVITLCSGAGWFGGFIAPALAKQLFNNPQLCVAGSGAATGTATVTPGGYIINGTWKYASGVHHATHITANCIIKQGSEPVLNDDGTPLILPFIVDSKDVTILPAWKFVGMMGTGSDAYEIKDLFVEQDRSFKLNPEQAIINEPLYRYPFLQLAEITLTANLSGMAVHFTDICGPVFTERLKKPSINAAQKLTLVKTLDETVYHLNNAREKFYDAVDASWQIIINKKTIDEKILEKVSIASRNLAKIARQSVDTLYPYCGLMAANPDTELNQVWRDIHTAGQHSLLTFDN